MLEGVIQLTSAEEFQRAFFFQFLSFFRKRSPCINKQIKMENPKANWLLTGWFLSPHAALSAFGHLQRCCHFRTSGRHLSLRKKSSENNQTQLKTESDILNLITHSSDVTLCVCASLSAFLAVLLGPLIQQKPEPKTDKDF